MRTWVFLFLISQASLNAQYLLLDRPLGRIAAGQQQSGAPEPNTGFLADRFRVGKEGEVWVVDAMTMWIRVDAGRGGIGSVFENIKLFGGLEAGPPKPGEIECDCHNLAAIKSVNLQSGSDTLSADGVHISLAADSLWQLDFGNLNWSVPGGVDIRFGAAGRKRAGVATAKWFVATVRTGAAHEIRMFDDKGKRVDLQNTDSRNSAMGFAVKVSGHLPVAIDIQPQNQFWEVILRNASSIEAQRATLRFGPSGAAPASVHADGADLVMRFRASDCGIRPGDVNACLTGQRADGVPFEGCDLLKRPPR